MAWSAAAQWQLRRSHCVTKAIAAAAPSRWPIQKRWSRSSRPRWLDRSRVAKRLGPEGWRCQRPSVSDIDRAPRAWGGVPSSTHRQRGLVSGPEGLSCLKLLTHRQRSNASRCNKQLQKASVDTPRYVRILQQAGYLLSAMAVVGLFAELIWKRLAHHHLVLSTR